MYPYEPGHKRGATETSEKAAAEVASRASSLRAKCIQVLSAAPDGLTADEVAAKLGESVLAIRPRISELRTMVKIVDTGIRRSNSSGHSAAVWKVASTGCAEASTTGTQQGKTQGTLFDNNPTNALRAIRGN